MTHHDDFLAAVRGIEGRHVAIALSTLTPGIDWRGCSKARMAKAYNEAHERGQRASYPQLKWLSLAQLAKRARARQDGFTGYLRDDVAIDAWMSARAAAERAERVRAAASELLAALRNVLALLGNAPEDRTADEQAAYALVARLEGKQ
jgi:hypothetical protein